MSTSDRQDQGPLTRKQLREIRLTGSTPVISPEEAAAAAVSSPPPLPRADERAVEEVEAAAESAESAEPAESADDAGPAIRPGSAPLTRRQVRELERTKTGSVAVDGADDEHTETSEPPAPSADAPAEPTASVDPLLDTPGFVPAVPSTASHVPSDDIDDADDDTGDQIAHAPVSAAPSVDSAAAIPLAPAEPGTASEEVTAQEVTAEEVTAEEVESDSEDDAVAAVAELGIEVETTDDVDDDADDVDDVLADVHDSEVADISESEHPTVNPAFGQSVLSDAADTRQPFAPSFDELLTVGDSTGSQHLAPSTLIFNPSPGDGSLSGPVASTGEILVTGSYELPRGLGSQGHAHGTTDGKDVDAVLIDGELPPSSSPTPIAASSAVSTIKPAGEVIRPPAPEKGNKLMLILAIVAGGLALALGVALIVAFNSNVF